MKYLLAICLFWNSVALAIPILIQKSVFGRVQSPRVEIIDNGASINSIRTPLSMTQPRELSIPPKNRFLNQYRYIALYYSPRCPYSQKVLSYLRRSDIQIPLKNVLIDANAKKELKETGGYMVVPCLIVDGAAIYDANDIIDWLSNHFFKRPQ